MKTNKIIRGDVGCATFDARTRTFTIPQNFDREQAVQALADLATTDDAALRALVSTDVEAFAALVREAVDAT